MHCRIQIRALSVAAPPWRPWSDPACSTFRIFPLPWSFHHGNNRVEQASPGGTWPTAASWSSTTSPPPTSRARKCPLAKFGHPREGRRDKLQIVFGLLTNGDGCPVAVEVFEGNTGDPKALPAQIQKIRERFALARVVLGWRSRNAHGRAPAGGSPAARGTGLDHRAARSFAGPTEQPEGRDHPGLSGRSEGRWRSAVT